MAALLSAATAATLMVGMGSLPAKADVVIASVPAGLTPANLAVNAVTNKIYVPNKDSQTVSVIDGVTNKAQVLITPVHPETAVVNTTTNKIYVGHSDGVVTIIDGATNSLTTIKTGGFSAGLVLDETRNLIYVANSRNIVVINGVDNSLRSIPVDTYARDLAINPTNNKLYISSGIDNFAVLDLGTSRMSRIDLHPATTGIDWIHDIGVNRVTNKVYVAHAPDGFAAPGSITVIDGTTDAATTIAVTSRPRHIEVNSKTNRIYLAHQTPSPAMTEINGATNAANSYDLGVDPWHTAINETTNKIYVTGTGQVVGVFNVETKSTGIIRNESGGYPGAFAINEKTNKVYVSNSERVDVVDGRNIAPSFTSGPPPIKGMVGSYYEHQFVAKGSLTPKFRVSAGTLPQGLSLSDAGLLSGVPTAAGASYFKVTAYNGVNPEAVTTTFTVVIKAAEVRHDFNGDGKPDVLARDGSGALWLYPGNGSGGWLPRKQVGQGWNVMAAIVASGDFNGDSKADVLASDRGGILWMYPGSGTGGWLPRTQVGQGWNGMTSITGMGDFNLDGSNDLIAGTAWGYFRLYPGNGKGGWMATQDIRHWVGSETNTYVGPGDFNTDGFQDILFRTPQGDMILVPGYKGSDFQSWNSATIGYGWNVMTAIATPGDFNSDGKVDLLARDAAGTLWLYPGNGKSGWLPRVQVGSGWNVMNAII